MSSHPGCTLDDAIALALYMKRTGQHPDQVQDFYPTPGTLSTAMFYTGIDPRDMKPVYVPRDPREKAMQRALMQYNKPQNHALVLAALRRAGREDLIGFGRECLVPPRLIAREKGMKKTGDGGKNPRASGKPRKSLPKRTAGGGKISSSGRVSGKTGKKPTSSRRHRD